MARHRTASAAEEASLLAAIHDDPRADAPRLVYADWLDDHGETEFAEFIRLQVARAGAVGIDAFLHGDGITPREEELAQTRADDWARPVSRQTACWRFLRGLPLVTLKGRAYNGGYPDTIVARSSPRARFQVEMAGWVRESLESELLARTAVLRVIDCTEDDAFLLAGCPYLETMELVTFGETMTIQTRAVCEDLLAPRVPVRYHTHPPEGQA